MAAGLTRVLPWSGRCSCGVPGSKDVVNLAAVLTARGPSVILKVFASELDDYASLMTRGGSLGIS